MELADRLLAGDPRALARGISLVEEDAAAGRELLRAVFPCTGRATVVGITGSPGAGKSSLVDRLVGSWRRDGAKVAVAAIDPSSAYSGGAILGDRVRMMDHAIDPGVFIRSMATRGHLGGLARATGDVIDLLDAAGYDPILVETVGVGQDEIDIVRAADVVAVILVPGMGDDIQAIKAGILEIADLFVVNKADRPGADRVISDLRAMMNLSSDTRPRPEIVKSVATGGEGIDEVRAAVARYLERTAGERDRRRLERADGRFRTLLSERLLRIALRSVLPGDAYAQIVSEIAARTTDPYTAVDGVLARLAPQAGS